jgi:hypothetical protein
MIRGLISTLFTRVVVSLVLWHVYDCVTISTYLPRLLISPTVSLIGNIRLAWGIEYSGEVRVEISSAPASSKPYLMGPRVLVFQMCIEAAGEQHRRKTLIRSIKGDALSLLLVHAHRRSDLHAPSIVESDDRNLVFTRSDGGV